jgi:hypothetical protein
LGLRRLSLRSACGHESEDEARCSDQGLHLSTMPRACLLWCFASSCCNVGAFSS